MVNSKSLIKWDWYSINLNWIPNILDDIKKDNITNWDVLFWNLSKYSINRNFAAKIFTQLKSFLISFEMVENTSNNSPKLMLAIDSKCLIPFLRDKYFQTNDISISLTKKIIETDFSLNFKNLPASYIDSWQEIKNFRIFSQYIQFLEFIKYGICIDKYMFATSEYLQEIVNMNSELLTKISIRFSDPRIMSAEFSRHTYGQHLTVSSGKYFLPFSTNKSNDQSIPIDSFFEYQSRFSISSYESALANYKNYHKSILANLGIDNVDCYIISAKLIIDYFFFGKRNFHHEILRQKDLDYIDNILKPINIKISQSIIMNFEKVYYTVTTLFWGSFYYNTYIHKLESLLVLKEDYFDIVIPPARELPLKADKNNLSILTIHYCILRILKLTKVIKKSEYYKNILKSLEFMVLLINEYLPQDKIDRKIEIDRLIKHITLSDDEIKKLLYLTSEILFPPHDQSSSLQVWYNINLYNKLMNDESVKLLINVRSKIQNKTKKLIGNIDEYRKFTV